MTDKRWAYEALDIGVSIALGERLVTAEEIIRSASQFDPQPMHLDEEAGKASILGGLAASGWHTCSMFMRMAYDAFLKDSTSQGGPGVTDLSWKRPVLAGDRLTGSSTVVERRVLKSRPHVGLVTFRHEVTNQRGETVMELMNPILFALRDPQAEQRA